MARVRIAPRNLAERKLVLLMVDLAGTARAIARLEAQEHAVFINTFFAACGEAVADHAGRIVTFLGDGFLATFEEGCGPEAIRCALQLRSSVAEIGREFDVDVELGANLHQAVVAEGEFEPDGHYNIMGTGIFHTFRMGAGPGIRISEPVYRQLPSAERAPWTKLKPPATYTYRADAS